jgi:acetolactate synthase-1/2/3 large subunit
VTGADRAIETAVAAGVEVCFANPGTTEMPFVAALDRVPGIRAVLGLFEGVCTGAADGYARMTGGPAMTLLHLGPGLANGLANLHNARRAHSPVVNVIGDHATWHGAADAPLTTDIVSLASPMSGWVRATTSARALASDMADAIAAAAGPRRQVATLIVPADCQWDEGAAAVPVAPGGRPAVEAARIERAASRLRGKAPVTLFLGGDALGLRGLEAAARIAAGSGCKLVNETFPARLERGAGIPAPLRLPYFPEQALTALAGTMTLVLAGANAPVAMFGYPDGPSTLAPPGCAVEVLAGYDEDVVGALEDLAELVGAAASAAPAARPSQPDLPTGTLNVVSLGAALAALQPEGAIIADESATSGGPYGQLSAAAPPHTVLGLTGGAIGHGFPTATGAALACPDRRVIALQADGSGLYTLQALWTQARESLNVTTLVCSNRLYRILQMEAARAGAKELARNARTLTELAPPEIGWVDIARGFGVPGARVTSADELVAQLRRALSTEGPYLIDMVL